MYWASMTLFEETYKTSYSHGLEAIYTLENIDLKSIRPIEKSKPALPSAPKFPHSKSHPLSLQLEFDFGDEYSGSMEAFLNVEPITVLGLSRHAEKCLLGNGKKVLKDLMHANLQDFVFFKGMGQGHLDEIQQKLNQYLDGRTLEKSRSVDFAAWIRSLIAALDRKKTYVAVHSYNLSDLFTLSPAETVEVNRLTLEKKQELIEEGLQLFREESRHQAVTISMRKMVNVFLKPWIRRRLGIASKSELTERLQRISENPLIATNVLKFFTDVYFDGLFPPTLDLYQVDEDLYCADEMTASAYCLIVKGALSYYYNPEISYTLSQLVSFLEREFALQWSGFAEGFVEKVLFQSPCFRVRKGPKGDLLVRLA